MSDNRVIIRRSDTGAEGSVVESEFKKHYPDVKYKVLGEETDQSFDLVGVPAQKAARRSPRNKGKRTVKVAPLASPKPSEVISPPQVEGEPA